MSTKEELQLLIDELVSLEIDFDEVEMLCGCTGVACKSVLIV